MLKCPLFYHILHKHWDKVILFISLLFCYYTTITDYYFFQDTVEEYIFQNHFQWIAVNTGRPIRALIVSLFVKLNSSNHYSYVLFKLILFVISYVFVFYVYYVINNVVNDKLLSLSFVSAFVSIPAFAINILWAALTVYLIGFLLSSISFYILYQRFIINFERYDTLKSLIVILFSLILNVAAEMVYQATTMMPAFFLLLHLLYDKKILSINKSSILSIIVEQIKFHRFSILVLSLIVVTQVVYLELLHNIFTVAKMLGYFESVDYSRLLSYSPPADMSISFSKFLFYLNINFNFVPFQMNTEYNHILLFHINPEHNYVLFVILILMLTQVLFKKIKEQNRYQNVSLLIKCFLILSCVILSSAFIAKDADFRVFTISSLCWFVLFMYVGYMFIKLNFYNFYSKIIKIPASYRLISTIVVFVMLGHINAENYTSRQETAVLSITTPLIEQIKEKPNANKILILKQQVIKNNCNVLREYYYNAPPGESWPWFYNEMLPIISRDFKINVQFPIEWVSKADLDHVDKNGVIILKPEEIMAIAGKHKGKCW